MHKQSIAVLFGNRVHRIQTHKKHVRTNVIKNEKAENFGTSSPGSPVSLFFDFLKQIYHNPVNVHDPTVSQ